MNYPLEAQGWGLQARSTFAKRGSGSALNPAMTRLSENYVKFNYTNFVLDVNSTSIAYSNRAAWGKYELAISSLNFGKWDEKDEQGNKLGTYSINDFYTRMNWAVQISDNLYGGANLNYGFSRLYDYTANYLTGGLGLVYTMDGGIVLGISTLNHVLTGKSYTQKEDLESLIVMGASKKLAYLPMRVGLDAMRTGSAEYYFNLGGLVSLEKIYLMWGLSSKREDLATENAVSNLFAGISGGMGVNLADYSLSVGYRNLGGMGAIVSLSFNWKFTKVTHE